MADDPLDVFRRGMAPKTETTKPSAPSLVVNHPSREPYEAFGTKDKIKRLKLRTKGVGHAVSYSYLHDIAWNLDNYSEIVLTVSGMLVTIQGTALGPIVDALCLETCDFVQEFIAEKFSPPVDRAAPVITRIEVEVIRAKAPFPAKEKEKS